MRAIDPIFVAPRAVERDWGRKDLGEWASLFPHRSGKVAEAWLHDAANLTDKGPFGRWLASDAATLLGDVGRAPPRVRLVFPGQSAEIASTAPVSFWTVLEPGVAADGMPGRRPGERIRAYEGARVSLPAGSVALEVSSVFQPANRPLAEEPSAIRLPPVSRRPRATLVREDALSVEMWTLPQWSRLAPDGETCHVVTALTPGVTLGGRRLRQGETVFMPAWGRPVDLLAREPAARVVVSYPDRRPTTIWRHSPGPDPMSGLMPRPEPASPSIDAAQPLPEHALAA